MSAPDSAFIGSIPNNYDRHMGPAMFAPYAADLIKRIRIAEGGRVLEIAAGTGIVTRMLRRALPASAEIVATDLNQPMLDYARQKSGDLDGLEWQQADAVALPFPEASFDAVICQFGLMFVPDKALALREARRVLRPGGQLLLNVWDSMAHNPFTLVTHEAVASFYAQDPPRFFAIPFGMSDRDELAALADQAGFADIRVDTVKLPGESESAASLATGLVEGTPLSLAIAERGTPTIGTIVAAVTAALAELGGSAPLRFAMQAHILEARAPD